MPKGPAKLTSEQVRKETLEALARYQKQGAVLTDAASIAERLKNESDRGLVIILVAYVEDELIDLVLEKINPSLTNRQRKRLLAPGAPLTSFSAAINVAEAMGLLTEYEVKCLEVLKAMRNACAHSRIEIDFSKKELQDATKLLVENFNELDARVKWLTVPADVMRAIFILVACLMMKAGKQSSNPFHLGLEIFTLMKGPQPPWPDKQSGQPSKGRRQGPKGRKRPPPHRSSRA